MKEAAFEFAGMSFGPKPDGWEEVMLVDTGYPPGLGRFKLWGRDWLGQTKTVEVESLTLAEVGLLNDGILRHAANKFRLALAQFKPLDALDVLRAAQ